jgi:hypothetical protein
MFKFSQTDWTTNCKCILQQANWQYVASVVMCRNDDKTKWNDDTLHEQIQNHNYVESHDRFPSVSTNTNENETISSISFAATGQETWPIWIIMTRE